MELKHRKLVKNSITNILRLVTGLILIASVFTACEDRNDLGIQLLPNSDLINVQEVEVSDEISAYTYTEESLVSSGGQSLLGSMNDPDFGSTHIDFAAQVRLLDFPDFGTDPVVDSVKFRFYFKEVYGDTITEQTFKVYELEETLNEDLDYKQDIDLKSMASDHLLGEVTLLPRVLLDSTGTDTLYQLVSIPLDVSIGEKLMNIDSTDLGIIDTFLNVFKGVYIESERVNGEIGNLISLSSEGMGLQLFYNNQENIDKDTAAQTLSVSYFVTEFSARVNSIEHDYTGTEFGANLNQEVEEGDLLYIQPTGGLKSKFYIDGLENWKDSIVVNGTDTIKYGINRAELVFQIDTVASDLKNFPPPSNLLFTFIDDDGEEKVTRDWAFNPYHGGVLSDGYVYRFNITMHLQDIINGRYKNNGFYLSTGRQLADPNRVILEGTGEKNGVQLNITYTKFIE